MGSKRRLGVLAMCGLMLGMMAISASGARAGTWMVNGKNVVSELKAEIGIGVEPLADSKVHFTYTFSSAGHTVKILCTKKQSSPSVAFGAHEIKISGTDSSCETTISGKATPECNPLSQPITWGGIITVVLHEGKPYMKMEGTSGVYATLKFECAALPEVMKITGTYWLEDANGELEKEKSTHLLQEAKVPAEKLGGLFIGASSAAIEGSFNLSLTDAEHKGMTFSGLAE